VAPLITRFTAARHFLVLCRWGWNSIDFRQAMSFDYEQFCLRDSTR
jgi:hypothetical protein